jgi:hypothetical protein
MNLPAAPLPDAHAAPACSSSRRLSSRGLPPLVAQPRDGAIVALDAERGPDGDPPAAGRADRLLVFGRLLVPSPLAGSRRISRKTLFTRSPPMVDLATMRVSFPLRLASHCPTGLCEWSGTDGHRVHIGSSEGKEDP